MGISLMATLVAAFVLVVLLGGLWWLMPILGGLPWIPTAHARIRKALELAQLRPGERLYDLGAGDGRVLILAAREFGARAIGIEFSPLHCLLAVWLARNNRLGAQVTVRREDFFQTDLRDADVVFAFMTSRQAPRLRTHLESQLRPGARVVTVSFDLDGWQPTAIDQTNLLFLYKMPPTPGNVASFLEQNNKGI